MWRDNSQPRLARWMDKDRSPCGLAQLCYAHWQVGGGRRLGVFDTHNVYMETEAENQTNTGTDSYTYINRQELSHNCYTPTHPAHAD